MSETAKEFVERMRKLFRGRIIFGFSLEDEAHLLALALRGAETQWRPIEEASDFIRGSGAEDAVLLGWVYNEANFIRYYPGSGRWKAGLMQKETASHFIPLTALGEPR